MNEPTVAMVGNLSTDPALRWSESGKAFGHFTLASSARVQDQKGEWKDGPTTFMRCRVWGQLAEHVANSLAKGDRAMVTGRLTQRSYEQDGERRTVTEVAADEVGPSLRFRDAQPERTQRSREVESPEPWGHSGPWEPEQEPAQRQP